MLIIFHHFLVPAFQDFTLAAPLFGQEKNGKDIAHFTADFRVSFSIVPAFLKFYIGSTFSSAKKKIAKKHCSCLQQILEYCFLFYS